MSKIVCPVCGGALMYHRIDDGEDLVEIVSDKKIIYQGGDSNGSTRVYCKTDESHKIDPELWDEVVTIAEGFGY